MILGFTGSRFGSTPQQFDGVKELVVRFKPELAVHGGCKGWDTEFDGICIELGIRRRMRPANKDSVLYCPAEEVYPVKPPLERDTDIVNDCDILIAAPLDDEEVLRSGTWATIRRGRKARKQIYIVKRNGFIFAESPKPAR